ERVGGSGGKGSGGEVGGGGGGGAWGRPAISRSRPSTCGGDRWQGICGQARPVACAKGCKERRRERRKIDRQHAAACAQDCKQRRRKRRKIDGQHAAARARTQENQTRDP